MNFIIDYLGIIAVVLTAILVYKKFKSGWFVKKETDSEKIQESKPESRFQKWWMKSYIREIYVFRASQIKFASWVGVAISAFFVLWFCIEVMETWMDQNVTVWIQWEYGILEGKYERVQVIDLNGVTLLGDKAYDRIAYNRKYLDDAISGLLHSLVWLLGFLALLWFINRDPIEQTTTITITNNKQ